MKKKKDFQKKYNLGQQIENVHYDIKIISCKPCGQSFKKKCKLSFHIEIKHPDFNMHFPEWSCEICKKSYPHSRALQAHIKLVHNRKPNHFCTKQ